MAGSSDFYLVLFPLHCATSWLTVAIKAFWKKSQYIFRHRTGKTKLTGVLCVDEPGKTGSLSHGLQKQKLVCLHCIHRFPVALCVQGTSVFFNSVHSHMTCFGQWHVGKNNTVSILSLGLEWPSMWPLVL